MVYEGMMESQSKYKFSFPTHCSGNTSNIIITLTTDTAVYRGIGKINN